MTIPPEVAFDRAIRQRFPDFKRGHYAGKMPIDPEEDPLLDKAHRLINEMYAAHAPRFLIPGHGTPHLYFDFIRGTAVNALAFQDNGYAFVALTIPLVDAFGALAQTLLSAPGVQSLLNLPRLNDAAREERWTALVFTMLEFVAFHELGHHLCGHCEANGDLPIFILEEYKHTSTSTALALQAGELDADEYAITTLGHNLLIGPARQELLTLLGLPSNDAADDHLLLTLLTLAVGTFFFYRQGKATATDFYAQDHPPPAARLGLAMSALQEWLEKYRPAIAPWVTHEYRRVMDAGTQALQIDLVGAAWNDHTDRLISPEGTAYLKTLEETRQRERTRLRPQRWMTIDVT